MDPTKIHEEQQRTTFFLGKPEQLQAEDVIPTWLILWLVLILLLFAAQGTGRFRGSKGDEGWQLLQAAAWFGVLLFPKLHLLLCTGGSRNFPIILELSWIIPAGMGKIRKSKTTPLGNAGHGNKCNGRGLELPGLHPRPCCIPDFPGASTDSAGVSPSPAGFCVLHLPARFPFSQILVEVLGSCL